MRNIAYLVPTIGWMGMTNTNRTIYEFHVEYIFYIPKRECR